MMNIAYRLPLALCGAAVLALCAPMKDAMAAGGHPTAARSVHAWHPAPPAEWAYGEVNVEKSVPGSYFCVIGFSCGYCGMQELYDGRKVAIFSVWDPGDPFDFGARPDSVDEKIRTKNLYAGAGVTVERFGGEGTGGKSMMPFDWKAGETCRFAVHVRRDGDHRAAFTGYVWRNGSWFRIATFSTLQTKGDPAIRDIYSFVEDFRRTNESVMQVRRASFLNFFAKPRGGEWAAIEAGRFTGDGNKAMMTVDAEIVPNGFVLTTGGNTENTHVKLYSEMRTAVGPRPDVCSELDALADDPQALFKGGDVVDGVKSAVYRIPALCTAPNGDLIAVCDARRDNGGDLNAFQSIRIACRRSTDGGKTWTPPVFTWEWPWTDSDKWSGSDPSLIVDEQAGKVFLLYNVWHWKNPDGSDRWGNVYRFYVQESSDNGLTWSRPRDITKDISFPEWPFGKAHNAGGFIFISSGSGMQAKDGTLLHTIVHVGDGNALFGSTDHGKTWRAFGRPVKNGDECKVVELSDGSWMINSRWKGGGRQIHVTKDRGETWESRYDAALADPQCNAQIMRVGKVLLFSNCNSPNRRHNLFVRASLDDGRTWNEGVCVEPLGAAYSDMCVLSGRRLGVVYEGAGYGTIKFKTLPLGDVVAERAGSAAAGLKDGSRSSSSLAAKIAERCTAVKTDSFHGFVRTSFDFMGCRAWIVEPSCEPAEGRPWTWTMQWATAFVPRTPVLHLLRRGWRHVTIDTFKYKMNDEGLKISKAFQDFLVGELGFAQRACLVGMSWGGFFSVRYTDFNPDGVAAIYLDCPLLNFDSFMSGPREKALSTIGPWAVGAPEKWSDDPRMPVNMAAGVAKSGAPVYLLYGGVDRVVPPAQNCCMFVPRLKAAGVDVKEVARNSYAHHPHGLEVDDPAIADFFVKSFSASAGGKAAVGR